MKDLFNENNPVWRFLSLIFNLIVLNWLFIITSIPIFTIGASFSALSLVTLKMVNKEEPYIVKGYFKAFRENFKIPTLLWLIMLALFLFFGADLYIVLNILDPAYSLLEIPVLIILFILLSIFFYAFPILSRYDTTLKKGIKNAILLSIANVPTTIFFVFIPVFLIYLSLKNATALVVIFSLFVFFGFAFLNYFYSLFLHRIFEKCDNQN